MVHRTEYKPRRVTRKGMKGKESSPRGTQEAGRWKGGLRELMGASMCGNFFLLYSFILFYIYNSVIVLMIDLYTMIHLSECMSQ